MIVQSVAGQRFAVLQKNFSLVYCDADREGRGADAAILHNLPESLLQESGLWHPDTWVLLRTRAAHLPMLHSWCSPNLDLIFEQSNEITE